MKILQRWIAVILATLLLVSVLPQKTEAASSEIMVLLDGKPVSFDVPPQLIENRTFVPFAILFRSMGADVTWDGNNRTVYAEKDGVKLRIPIGSNQIFHNEQPIQMDVASQIVDGRTLIPLSFAAQTFGSYVQWSPATSILPFTVYVDQQKAAQIHVYSWEKASAQQIQTIQNMVQNSRISEKISEKFKLSYQSPTHIYILKDQAEYRDVLLQLGYTSQTIDLMVKSTAGLATDSVIYINLSVLPSDQEIKSTITHELVHILFNQNRIYQMSSWINEGLAWDTEMQLGYEQQPITVREGVIQKLRASVLRAKQDGVWVGLMDNESDILDNLDIGYNVELQDWMAVDYLVEKYGDDKVLQYIHLLRWGGQNSFFDIFGVTSDSFEADFDSSLDQELQGYSR